MKFLLSESFCLATDHECDEVRAKEEVTFLFRMTVTSKLSSNLVIDFRPLNLNLNHGRITSTKESEKWKDQRFLNFSYLHECVFDAN